VAEQRFAAGQDMVANCMRTVALSRGNHSITAALMSSKEASMTRKNSQNSQKHDAGSRTRMHTSDPRQLNPGDEAAPGTPGTGEDICPQCHGSGRMDSSSCPNCGGTGKIVKAIGGA
jgi:DnaJ-class molecular chaperone